MTGPSTLILLALIGAPGSGTTTPLAEPPGDAQAYSILAGRVLGAAASCEAIAGSRIDRDADAFGAVIERLARSDAERDAARHALVEAVSEGGAAIDNHDTNCATAAAALEALEQKLPR